MIQVERLTKYFGLLAAIDDVTFRVEKGEILGFLGPNGAGKSTTMRILAGFFPATEGRARVAGYDVFEEPLEAKRRVGYLPESPPLYTEMTVDSYLRFVARVKGVKGVFAVCPPLRLQNLSSRFVPAVDAWNRWMDIISISSAKKEFVENRPENPHINYFRNPIHGVRELGMLMEALEPKLPGIQTPALVVQSDKDPVVDPRGSRKIFDLIGSQNKEYTLFNFERHGILLGEGSRRIHKAIGGFIKQF